jgi:hypothetical protein
MIVDLALVLGPLGGLSEGERTIAHLLVLLALVVAAGLVYFIRRRARGRDQTEEGERVPEEQ